MRRERVISNFDTKTIRVSSSPATLSYLTRCLGSLYGDAGGRVRNEEKGKGKGMEKGEKAAKGQIREEAKMRREAGTRTAKKRKRKREIDRRHEICYLNSKQTL